MLVNVNDVLTDYKGQPIDDYVPVVDEERIAKAKNLLLDSGTLLPGEFINITKTTPFMLGDALIRALDNSITQETKGKEKYTIGSLCMRIVGAQSGDGKLTLTDEEREKCRDAVGRFFKPVVVICVWNLLKVEV